MVAYIIINAKILCICQWHHNVCHHLPLSLLLLENNIPQQEFMLYYGFFAIIY